MLSIFAGLDKDGVTRYIGDVPRGAACGCFCEACGSPLVARQGDIKEWHFAHEASQERPECIAGAVNLLRRTAISVLKTTDRLLLPPFRAIVRSEPPSHLFEEVSWDDPVRAVSDWNFRPALNAPVARIELCNGVLVDLHVEVSDAVPRNIAAWDTELGMVSYWIPLPAAGQLRNESDALAHVRDAGGYVWNGQPDVHGLARAALARLNERGRHLAEERDGLRAWGDRQSGLKRTAGRTAGLSDKAPVAPVDESRWIAWRNPQRAFIFYGFKDGSSWLLIEHRDGRAIIVPWPRVEDGWEESFPARVCTFDETLEGLVLSHHVNGMIYLGSKSSTTLTASNAAELAKISWPDGATPL